MILIHACIEISKYHVVALHFTCMGTSRISSVSARHGFEQEVFLGRLSTISIEVFPIKNISEGCLQYYQSLSNEKNIGGWPNILSEPVQ